MNDLAYLAAIPVAVTAFMLWADRFIRRTEPTPSPCELVAANVSRLRAEVAAEDAFDQARLELVNDPLLSLAVTLPGAVVGANVIDFPVQREAGEGS